MYHQLDTDSVHSYGISYLHRCASRLDPLIAPSKKKTEHRSGTIQAHVNIIFSTISANGRLARDGSSLQCYVFRWRSGEAESHHSVSGTAHTVYHDHYQFTITTHYHTINLLYRPVRKLEGFIRFAARLNMDFLECNTKPAVIICHISVKTKLQSILSY